MESETRDKALEFVAANKESPVVYGSVMPRGGGYYTLENGKSFRLSPEECRRISLIAGTPRWKLP